MLFFITILLNCWHISNGCKTKSLNAAQSNKDFNGNSENSSNSISNYGENRVRDSYSEEDRDFNLEYITSLDQDSVDKELFEACFKRNVKLAKFIIENTSANVNQLLSNETPLLILVCEYRNYELFKLLLDSGAKGYNDRLDGCLNAVIRSIYDSSYSENRILNMLLDNADTYDINFSFKQSAISSLELAFKRKYFDIAESLIQKGAKFREDFFSKENLSLSYFSKIIDENRVILLQAAIEANYLVRNDYYTYYEDYRCYHDDTFKDLFGKSSKGIISFLDIIIRRKKYKFLELFLTLLKDSDYSQNRDIGYILYKAIKEYRDEKLITIFHELGYDFNKYYYISTKAIVPLNCAIAFAPELIDFFIDRGADINLKSSLNGYPIFNFNIYNGKEALSVLSKYENINWNVLDERGNSILQFAVLKKLNFLVDFVLKQSVSVTNINNIGYNALMIAATRKEYSGIKSLVGYKKRYSELYDIHSNSKVLVYYKGQKPIAKYYLSFDQLRFTNNISISVMDCDSNFKELYKEFRIVDLKRLANCLSGLNIEGNKIEFRVSHLEYNKGVIVRIKIRDNLSLLSKILESNRLISLLAKKRKMFTYNRISKSGETSLMLAAKSNNLEVFRSLLNYTSIDFFSHRDIEGRDILGAYLSNHKESIGIVNLLIIKLLEMSIECSNIKRREIIAKNLMNRLFITTFDRKNTLQFLVLNKYLERITITSLSVNRLIEESFYKLLTENDLTAIFIRKLRKEYEFFLKLFIIRHKNRTSFKNIEPLLNCRNKRSVFNLEFLNFDNVFGELDEIREIFKVNNGINEASSDDEIKEVEKLFYSSSIDEIREYIPEEMKERLR